jgi:hypothetical protein
MTRSIFIQGLDLDLLLAFGLGLFSVAVAVGVLVWWVKSLHKPRPESEVLCSLPPYTRVYMGTVNLGNPTGVLVFTPKSVSCLELQKLTTQTLIGKGDISKYQDAIGVEVSRPEFSKLH